jgi:hypothetical protein
MGEARDLSEEPQEKAIYIQVVPQGEMETIHTNWTVGPKGFSDPSAVIQILQRAVVGIQEQLQHVALQERPVTERPEWVGRRLKK